MQHKRNLKKSSYLISFFYLLIASSSFASSLTGLTTYPLNKEGRALSAEILGHMALRQEMGTGLRYTQEHATGDRLDLYFSGGQYSRALTTGVGVDYQILKEEKSGPRFSLKPYYQYQKFENSRSHSLGVAPTLRKGLSLSGQEYFPYVAFPSGIRLDNETNEFKFANSLTLGLSSPYQIKGEDRLIFSFEGNKNFGASSDYLSALVSWVWK